MPSVRLVSLASIGSVACGPTCSVRDSQVFKLMRVTSTADGKLYVADGVNRQVLIIGFTYAAADTAVVPK